jgi:hypothetical protein
MFFKKGRKINQLEGQALLLTASDDVEAIIVVSMLKANEIPATKVYREDGGFFTMVLGKSLMGVDVFVPEEMLDSAKEILDSAQDINDEEILADPSFDDASINKHNEESLKSLGKKALWIGVALLAIIAAYLIFYFFLK